MGEQANIFSWIKYISMDVFVCARWWFLLNSDPNVCGGNKSTQLLVNIEFIRNAVWIPTLHHYTYWWKRVLACKMECLAINNYYLWALKVCILNIPYLNYGHSNVFLRPAVIFPPFAHNPWTTHREIVGFSLDLAIRHVLHSWLDQDRHTYIPSCYI